MTKRSAFALSASLTLTVALFGLLYFYVGARTGMFVVDVSRAEAQTYDLPKGLWEGTVGSVVVQFRDLRGNSQQPDSIQY